MTNDREANTKKKKTLGPFLWKHHKAYDNRFFSNASLEHFFPDSLSLSKHFCTKKEIAVGGQGHLTLQYFPKINSRPKTEVKLKFVEAATARPHLL